MAATFSSALSFALSCVGKPTLILKDKQLEALKCLYAGSDVFLWVPTGYGKSICFQMLPFLFDAKLGRTSAPMSERSIVLVVSPLVSLMVDQVSSLQSVGLSAAILSNNKGVDKKYLAVDSEIMEGKYRLIYSSPEALFASGHWMEMMLQLPLSKYLVAIAIDEAHCVYKWSEDFRPDYARLSELRAFAPPGTPVLAATATVTESMRRDVISQLDLSGCTIVSESPNKPNMYYCVERLSRNEIDVDLLYIVEDLSVNSVKAKRIIVYCRTLNMCSDLYAHFVHTLGNKSYYPRDAEQISDNRLFGMYHSRTDEHNKQVILKSMTKVDGVVRVVFATMALGMGVNFVGLSSTIHYGAPRSLDDYFQESGRAGRSGEPSTSTIYWTPRDAPTSSKGLQDHGEAEVTSVRRYLEDTTTCRRYMLLQYFDVNLAKKLVRRSRESCCDNCRKISEQTVTT